MESLKPRLKQQAHALGFELVGIAPAVEAAGFGQLRDWLGRGHPGRLAYLQKHADARRHPESILPEVRSVVMVGISYAPAADDLPLPRGHGKVARYARGLDYHDVLWEKLNRLLEWV